MHKKLTQIAIWFFGILVLLAIIGGICTGVLLRSEAGWNPNAAIGAGFVAGFVGVGLKPTLTLMIEM